MMEFWTYDLAIDVLPRPVRVCVIDMRFRLAARVRLWLPPAPVLCGARDVCVRE